MKRNFVFLLAGILFFLASCRKDGGSAGGGTVPKNAIELTADSVYLYSKEVYFWNTALPDYNNFKPRSYVRSNELLTAQAVIEKLRTYNTQDNSHGYSYATTYEQGGLAKMGEDIDYGFFIKAGYTLVNGQITAFKGWYVCYVYPMSKAGQAGVKRGWKLSKVNGTAVGADDASQKKLNDIFVYQSNKADSTTTFEFTKPDGSTQTNTFNIERFTADPVLYKNVITATNGKKVGYMVFNRFFGASAVTDLQSVFQDFESKGVNELILDLRYNLGGITATQDVLANYIAPASASGGLMYTFEYNQNLQNDTYADWLKKRYPAGYFSKNKNKVNFTKRGGLNFSRVFIIVSDNTASASELLINNLKPVMNVQLIGDDNTFGKPVGFFGIDLFKKVTFYPVSFRTINRNNQGDYYNGFTPDKTMYDGVDRDWGDQSGQPEDCYYAALYYINNGIYPVSSTTTSPRSVYSVIPKLGNKAARVPGMVKYLE